MRVVAHLAGTVPELDFPLMSAGLDSMGATELVHKLSDRLATKLASTLLFDHPSMGSLGRLLASSGGRNREIATRDDRAGTPAPQVPADGVARAFGVVEDVLRELGTMIASEASLMAAGLDSIAATELSRMVGERLCVEMPSTVLFDHPTAGSMVYFATGASRCTSRNCDRMSPGRSISSELGRVAAASGSRAPLAPLLDRAYSVMIPGPPYCAGAGLMEVASTGAATCSAAPLSRWDTAPANGVRVSAAYGAFLGSGMPAPDAETFGVSSLEAQTMDPQVTLVMESSYGALCHATSLERKQNPAGCRGSLANQLVGFFLGMGGTIVSSGRDGANVGLGGLGAMPKAPSVYSGTSGALSVASGRVSYTLGLTGPCASLDTACSSSLVALHLVSSALILDECPRAAATGVGLLTAGVTYAFSAAGMLSALGRCSTFDRRADGYCRGEGCCTFVLDTPLEAGPRPSANVSIVVGGSRVQQDGPSASLTAPNGAS